MSSTIEAGTWLNQDEVDYNLDQLPEEFIDDHDPEKGVKVKVGFEFEPGESIDDAVEIYGEEVVFERWLRQVRRDGGNAVRSSLSSGKHPSAVQDEMEDWRPDVSRRGSSKSEDIEDQFKQLPPEEREAKLERLIELAQEGPDRGEAQPA